MRKILRPDLALILGGGRDLWLEIGILEEMIGGKWPGLVIAANNAGAEWPRDLDHWVTLHPEKFNDPDPDDGTGDWIRKREENGYPNGFITWGRRSPELVDRVIQPWGGMASGGFGCRVGHHMITEAGLEPKAVLCGVPMTETPHYHKDHHRENWRHAELHWRSWERHLFRVDGWVRSMSGRTRETLGYPSKDWLEA